MFRCGILISRKYARVLYLAFSLWFRSIHAYFYGLCHLTHLADFKFFDLEVSLRTNLNVVFSSQSKILHNIIVSFFSIPSAFHKCSFFAFGNTRFHIQIYVTESAELCLELT